MYPASFLAATGTLPADLMCHVGHRLASLYSLPASCNMYRTRLAEAGFYYDTSKAIRDASNIHEVVCYSCNLTYGRWKKGDNPLNIHRELRPDCSHMKTLLARRVETATTNLAYNTEKTRSLVPNRESEEISGNSLQWKSALISVDSGIGTFSSSLPPQQQQYLLQPSLSPPSPGRGYQSGHSSGQSMGHLSSHHADSGFSSGVPTDVNNDGSGLENNGGSAASLSRRSTSQGDSLHLSNNQSLHSYPRATNGERIQEVEDRPPLVMSNAVHPRFSGHQERLATFINWPLDHVFQPDELSLQGFFYAGYADCIRCFYCGVGFKDFQESDDVVKEHIRWKPFCGYLLNKKGKQVVDRVLEELRNETNTSNCYNGTPRDSTEISTPASVAPSNNSNRTVSRTSSSYFSSFNRCTATTSYPEPDTARFVSSPSSRAHSSSSPITPDSSGRNSEDVLKQVEGMGFSKDAIQRAVRNLRQRGQSKINAKSLVETILELPASNNLTTNTTEVLHTESTSEDTANTSILFEELRLKNVRLRNRDMCRICHEAKVGMIFLPCGHVVACPPCGSKITKCPNCGQIIRGSANIYLP